MMQNINKSNMLVHLALGIVLISSCTSSSIKKKQFQCETPISISVNVPWHLEDSSHYENDIGIVVSSTLLTDSLQAIVYLTTSAEFQRAFEYDSIEFGVSRLSIFTLEPNFNLSKDLLESKFLVINGIKFKAFRYNAGCYAIARLSNEYVLDVLSPSPDLTALESLLQHLIVECN